MAAVVRRGSTPEMQRLVTEAWGGGEGEGTKAATFLAQAWWCLSASSCCDRTVTPVLPVKWPGNCFDAAHSFI